MTSALRIMRGAARIPSRATLSYIILGSSWAFIACSSDEAGPLPVAAAGASGASATAGSGGAGGATAGASAGGASTGGASTAGSGGASGSGGSAPVEPFVPVVLFQFNAGNASDAGDAGDAGEAGAGVYGWTVEPTGSIELVSEDRDPNSTTPGALRFTATFQPYNVLGTSLPTTALYTFGDPTTGTNRTLAGGARVHFWVRLVSPPGSPPSLAFFQPFIQGGAATGYLNNFGYVQGPAVADNLWHEFVLEVAGQTYMTDVWRVGLQVAPAPLATADAADGGITAVADAGDAGTVAPAPLTFDIDYIWIE